MCSAPTAQAHSCAVVGVVNVPIIHYSVLWWNSLHQARRQSWKLAKPEMPAAMLIPLLMMLAGFTLFFVALLLVRLRGEVLRRETQLPQAGSARLL